MSWFALHERALTPRPVSRDWPWKRLQFSKLGSESPPATRARGAGGGRLQTNELAAPVQDEVAPGENGRAAPHATDPSAEHAKGILW